MLGVARLPEPPILINAVAVRDMAEKKPVYPPGDRSHDPLLAGMLTHDRLFVSSMPGSDPESGKVPNDPAAQVDLALDRVEAVLKAAGLQLGNMVFVNPYLTTDLPTKVMNEHYAKRFEFGNTPARATIEVSSLPGGAHIEYTGVAVRDLAQRKAVRPKNMPPVQRRVPAYLRATLCIARPRMALFPARMAAFTRRPRHINSARACAICSTISKRPI